jgi:hypothetical protein
LEPNVRACMAYIAGRLISGRSPLPIFDSSQSKYIYITGPVDRHGVRIFDYDQGCFFGGSGSDGKFHLYHHRYGHYVSLTVRGNRFSGFDFGRKYHFTGKVEANAVSLYDQEVTQHFFYSL